jgi:hypothetical protein
MKLMDRILKLCGIEPQKETLSHDVRATVDAATKVADELHETSAAVNKKLRTYLDADKPFMAMLIDVHNEQARKQQLSQWDQPG